MAIAFCFTPSSNPTSFSPLSKHNPHRPFFSSSSPSLNLRVSLSSPTSLSLHHHKQQQRLFIPFSTPNDTVFPGGDDNNNNNNHNNNGKGGDGGGNGGGDEGSAEDKNRKEVMMVLAEAGRSLKSLPNDLAAAIESGRVPGSVVTRFLELEKSPLFRWLMQFGGFKERLLADDLFLAKVGFECGVGIFTKVSLFSSLNSGQCVCRFLFHF
jgi:hypothetical protein